MTGNSAISPTAYKALSVVFAMTGGVTLVLSTFITVVGLTPLTESPVLAFAIVITVGAVSGGIALFANLRPTETN